MNETEIRHSIRSLEKYRFRSRFPEELEEYFYEAYGNNPRSWGFTRGDIYSGIKADAAAYFAGKLIVREHLRPPENDPAGEDNGS